MKRIALLIACCCLVLSGFAQYYTNQNKVWAFGNGACIDFNSGSPVAFPSSIYANEGTSSVCNSAGSLLFYSDGQKVYNRLGLITPGGGAVVPFTTWSSTQGSLIVPFFNDTNKYYVFSLESYGTSSGKLAYSIVDMTLDGGLGDVVAGSAGTIISTGMSEKMIAIPGNSCNIWLMVHRIDSPKFYAYEITSSGISTTPVISYEGTLLGTNSNEIGVIKCSHDRQKIVGIGHHIGTMWGVELFDFNPTTGIVSNCRVLEASPTANPYGAEFSPDNSKLYTSSYMQINQWDLSLPTTAAIIASKIKIDSSTSYYSDLRLAPDGKIYYQQYSTSSLARINFPNLPGAMCGMATSVVSLAPGTGMLGFPNLVWRVQAILDTATVCAGATITLTPTGSGGTWSSSDPTVATVTASGVVTGVSVGTANIFYTTGPGCPETTFITVTPGGTIIGKTTLCEGFSTMLSCGTTGGYWSSSSPNATVSPSGLVTGISAGTAIISYVVPGPCIPTAIITINPMPAPIIGPTTVVAGSTITLTNATAGGSWTSSDSARALPDPTGVITGVTPGTATIYYILPTGCKQTVVINVTSKNTTAIGSIQSTRSMLYPNPATNEISVIADPSAFKSFDIYNAIGQVIATQEITGSQTVMNVKAYPPGEYQVVFKGNAAREVIRFTKW